MITYKGKVDENDLSYVTKRHGTPLRARPAPINEVTGEPNPHATLFLYEGNRIEAVFTGKPIYYEDKNNEWRPLSEVTVNQNEYGKTYMRFTENGWRKLSERYKVWIAQRMEHVANGQIGIVTNVAKEFKTLSLATA